MLKFRHRSVYFTQIRSILNKTILDYSPKVTNCLSNFDNINKYRIEQARRTAIIEYDLVHEKTFLMNILKELDRNKAIVKRVFYHINKKYNSLIVEFDSIEDLHKFIQSRPVGYVNYTSQESIFNQRCFYCKDFVNDGIILSKVKFDYLEEVASKLRNIEITRIRDFSRNRIYVIEKLYPNDLESQIREAYKMKKMNEMGIRIRYFFAALLSEKLNILCYPSRGSFSSFSEFNYDLDLAIEIPENNKRIVELLFGMLQSLKNCNDISELRYDYNRVPILKFKHHILYSDLDVHISANAINNQQSYLMTKLIWTYSILDTNLAYLMSFFRYWATELNILDTWKKDVHTFNYFILNLLVLNFLISFNLIPKMSELIINGNEDIRDPYHISFNTSNQTVDLVKCILGFFAYYSQFDFKTNRINFVSDIREIDRLTMLKRRPFIEQPFIKGANVAFKVDMNEVDDFKEKCLYSFNKIKPDSNLISCVNEIRDFFINKID